MIKDQKQWNHLVEVFDTVQLPFHEKMSVLFDVWNYDVEYWEIDHIMEQLLAIYMGYVK